MKKQLTLRQLVEKLVIAATKDTCKTGEMVEKILNSSMLKVSKGVIELQPENEFGVGENNKDRLLSTDQLKYLLLVIGNQEEEYWSLINFSSLESLEREVRAKNYGDSECDLGILIDGEEQNISINTTPNLDYQGFFDYEVVWLDIKPYALRYLRYGIYIEEDYNSKQKVENRIIALHQDTENKDFSVYNRLDEFFLGFTLQVDTLKVEGGPIPSKNELNTRINCLWHTPFHLGEYIEN